MEMLFGGALFCGLFILVLGIVTFPFWVAGLVILGAWNNKSRTEPKRVGGER